MSRFDANSDRLPASASIAAQSRPIAASNTSRSSTPAARIAARIASTLSVRCSGSSPQTRKKAGGAGRASAAASRSGLSSTSRAPS